jgi:hypothetical protein
LQHSGVWACGSKDLINRAKIGTNEQLLLVRDPLAAGGKHRVWGA